MALSKYSEITILLADDHPLFRKGVRNAIRALGFTGSIIEAQNGREVLEISGRRQIDLYLLDYKMPEMDGYETSRAILRDNHDARIIVISMYDEPSIVSSFYQLGVLGFLGKNSDIDEIESTIVSVLDDGHLFQARHEHTHSNGIHFTPREMQLIEMLDKGFTSKTIAENLGLSFRTIETYRCRLLEKVHARNTSELLYYVHKKGLM